MPPAQASAPPTLLRQRLKVAALIDVGLALPWLWWSWLSVQFVGIPSDTIANVALGVWLVSGAALLYPRTQDLLAWKVWRLRPPSEMESRRIGPAWWAVCAAAGVNPDRYRVWIHEGPEATAPQTAGSTVAVTSWSVYTLPPRNLEAVLAHELAHRLAVPGWLSLMIYWYSLPARALGAIRHGVKVPGLSTVIKLAIGFLVLGVFLVAIFTSFDGYFFMMISPVFAPIVVAWASRASEKYADRVTADLGQVVSRAQADSHGALSRRRARPHADNTSPVAASTPVPYLARRCGADKAGAANAPFVRCAHGEHRRVDELPWMPWPDGWFPREA
jgi:Zn-dependent protease with chaperone function